MVFISKTKKQTGVYIRYSENI